MSDIFMSYSEEDSDASEKLFHQLKICGLEFGVTVFRASDIPPGADRLKTIDDELTDCSCLAALVSPEYVKSNSCNYEINKVNDLGKEIFPIIWSDTALTRLLREKRRSRIPMLSLGREERATRLREFAEDIVKYLLPAIPEVLAQEYQTAPNADKKRDVLTKLALDYEKIKEAQPVGEAITFARRFDDAVAGKERHLDHSGIDIYSNIIELLSTGITRPAHFVGLNRVKPYELTRNPAYPVMLLAMSDTRTSYKAARARLLSIESSDWITSCGLYASLKVQYYRKTGMNKEALGVAREALAEIESWHEDEPSCKCAYCRSPEGPVVLALEFYRAIGSIYRVLGDLTQAQEWFKKATEFFTEAGQRFTRGSGAYADIRRKGSDVYFSYGYLLFEEYFKYFPETDAPSTVDAISDALEQSQSYDRRNSAPSSRLAIILLYQGRHGAAFDFFENRVLRYFNRSPLNIEELFTRAWSGLAQHQLLQTDIVEREPQHIKTLEEVEAAAAEIFKNTDIPTSPLRCHEFNLQVIDWIFKKQGNPMIPRLRKIVDDWAHRVAAL